MGRRLRELWGHLGWAQFPVGLFLGVRVALLAFASAAAHLPGGFLFTPVLDAPLGAQLAHYPAVDALCRWDCGWFERIAQHGYRDFLDTNIWPLFPLLGRGLSYVLHGNVELALILCANAASLAAYLVLYRLFREQADEASARSALLLFVAYPFAFFHSAAYTEPFLICFSALATYFALHGRHARAGIALGVGVLARHVTILFGGALLVAQIRQRGLRVRRLVLHPAFFALALPFALASLFLVYQRVHFGSAVAFWKSRQQGWGEQAWWGIWQVLTSHQAEPRHRWFLLFSLIPAAGTLMLLRRRAWGELACGAAVFMTVLYAVGAEGLGRYSASCWPAFLPLGAWLSRRPSWQAPVLATLTLFQGLFFYLFIHQFPIL